MTKDWPTQQEDLMIAEQVISKFVAPEATGLSLFELVVNIHEKNMDFALSAWVVALADKFTSLYGEEEGEDITRRVISCFMRNRQTLH